MQTIGTFLYIIIVSYKWIVVISAILSWLITFDVVNRRNRLVNMVEDFTRRLTEPLLRPIRRFVPSLGGIDISPMILILVLLLLQLAIENNLL